MALLPLPSAPVLQPHPSHPSSSRGPARSVGSSRRPAKSLGIRTHPARPLGVPHASGEILGVPHVAGEVRGKTQMSGEVHGRRRAAASSSGRRATKRRPAIWSRIQWAASMWRSRRPVLSVLTCRPVARCPSHGLRPRRSGRRLRSHTHKKYLQLHGAKRHFQRLLIA